MDKAKIRNLISQQGNLSQGARSYWNFFFLLAWPKKLGTRGYRLTTPMLKQLNSPGPLRDI